MCLSTFCCFAQTQTELNVKAANCYKKADQELNKVYQQIIKEYQSDPVFIKNLRNAQSSWIQFRDAEMKTKYPDKPKGYYGSIQPLCWYNYLSELTTNRTKQLKIWLTGIDEGNACAGSVKIKHLN